MNYDALSGIRGSASTTIASRGIGHSFAPNYVGVVLAFRSDGVRLCCPGLLVKPLRGFSTILQGRLEI